MTLEELIADLKAAGANENTLQLAMNCYEMGIANEREACEKRAEIALLGTLKTTSDRVLKAIRAGGQQ